MTEDASELITDPVRVWAHAKLTLSLRVRGRRDDGFHDLVGLVASVDAPSDLVEVALRGGPEFTLQLAGLDEGVPADDSNLASRAARLILRRAEPGAGAGLRVKKGIPAGAGLGGGSADAAAVLRAVAHLLPDEAGGIDLLAMAAALGSDVPFCVSGGLAWMRGRGELVEPLTPVEGWRAVIAVPPLAVATAEVYAAWDEMGEPCGDPVPAPALLAHLTTELVNDLEPAALTVEPRLREFRDRFEAAAGHRPLLAGSGSAYFIVLEGDDDPAPLVAALSGLSALVAVAQPVAEGVSPAAG